MQTSWRIRRSLPVSYDSEIASSMLIDWFDWLIGRQAVQFRYFYFCHLYSLSLSLSFAFSRLFSFILGILIFFSLPFGRFDRSHSVAIHLFRDPKRPHLVARCRQKALRDTTRSVSLLRVLFCNSSSSAFVRILFANKCASVTVGCKWKGAKKKVQGVGSASNSCHKSRRPIIPLWLRVSIHRLFAFESIDSFETKTVIRPSQTSRGECHAFADQLKCGQYEGSSVEQTNERRTRSRLKKLTMMMMMMMKMRFESSVCLRGISRTIGADRLDSMTLAGLIL